MPNSSPKTIHPSDFFHSGREQTSTFLKQEISNIIKNQLKAYHLRNKMQAELNQYNKQKENESLVVEKITNFRQHQEDKRQRQVQLCQQRLKQKQAKVAQHQIIKQKLHQNKVKQFNRSFFNVQQRYSAIVRQDSEARFSKLPTNTQIKPSTLYPQRNSFSQNSSRLNVVKSMEEELQKQKITKYITKVQKSGSRILFKQLQNNKRRENILKKKVKCLIGIRKKNQEDMMENTQKEYNQKMQNFTINKSRILQKQHNTLMSQSMLKTRTIQQVANKRRLLHQSQISNIVASYNNKGKENIMKKYRSELDLNYTHQNRQKIITRMKIEQQQREYSHRMEVLSQKLRKIKEMRQGEKLDQRTVAQLASMLDKNDEEFPKILQFLRSERTTYIQGLVKKEEQGNRGRRLNKTLSKLSII